MKKYSISVLILSIALIFFGCDVSSPITDIFNSTDEEVTEVLTLSSVVPDDSDNTDDAVYIYNDSNRAIAVYVDSDGTEIPIQSDEKAGNIFCSEVTDYLLFEDNIPASRSAGFERQHAKAFVLGKRSDGYTGLWVVYSDGKVRPVINGEGFDTTKLLDMVEGRQPLSGYFNWDYKALEMIANEDKSEIIIIGYAENSGVERHNYTIEEGTTIGVYWSVILDEDDYYHISRARVIGYKDVSEWKKYTRYFRKSHYKNHHRWMWTLRTFFAGWYDKYLVMPASIEAGENAGEYRIYGIDQDDEDAVAVVTANKVLSIDKYEVQDDNQPPVAEFATWDLEISGAEIDSVNQNYTANGTAFGRTKYISDSSPQNEVFYYWNNSIYEYEWGINETQLDYIESTSELDFYQPVSKSLIPPETGWYSSASGSESQLRIIQVPIHGDFSTIGAELTASYIFTDPDSDAESNSLYQWYRCASEDAEGVAIDGATGVKYLTDSLDQGSYLKFEVTPVDERGGVGTPVKSEATPIIGENNT